VITGIDLAGIRFAEPGYLWLLIVPVALAACWLWRLGARHADARRLAHRRTLPVRERITRAGDLPFWLCLIGALALLIGAIARPQGPRTAVRQAGVDLVILQDASASMRVRDVAGDRWQRSIRFLRLLGDSLSWEHDRIAMAVFARIAAPQVRLTKDPNTYFFFLNHLEEQPPFRLENEGTWDTNLERAIHWGLRLIERDEELHGTSRNAKLLVAITDGEVWSGALERSLQQAIDRNVPVYVVGVGTLGGGQMPQFKNEKGEILFDPEAPTRSRLNRRGLQEIASAGGGRYFELDRNDDRYVATTIIDAGKRLAPTLGVTEEAEELYWYFLAAAAMAAGAGLLFLRDPADLWIQVVGGTVALLVVSAILR
jgi:Ca-activated chloride channel family protein